MIREFFSSIFTRKGKYVNIKENIPKKKVYDYLDVINARYNIKDIDDSISAVIKRYELDFNSINIKYDVELFDVFRMFNGVDIREEYSILLFSYIGRNSNTVEYTSWPSYGWREKVSCIPSNLDVYNIIDSCNYINMFDVYSGRTTGISSTNDSIDKCINSDIVYGVFRLKIVYKGDDPEDIIMDAFNFLESKYGLNLLYTFNKDLNGNKSIVSRIKISL